jgi:hypothetical protein
VSETQRRARKAKQELEMTAEAFTALRIRHIKDILAAASPEEAYDGVLAVRALESVAASLQSLSDTALIEEMEEAYAE